MGFVPGPNVFSGKRDTPEFPYGVGTKYPRDAYKRPVTEKQKRQLIKDFAEMGLDTKEFERLVTVEMIQKEMESKRK